MIGAHINQAINGSTMERILKRLALFLVLMTAPAAAQGTFPRDTLGCRDKSIVERSARLQIAGDSAGFGALMTKSRRSGACVVIKGGTSARSIARDERFECVVLDGEAGSCVWTPRGQLRP